MARRPGSDHHQRDGPRGRALRRRRRRPPLLGPGDGARVPHHGHGAAAASRRPDDADAGSHPVRHAGARDRPLLVPREPPDPVLELDGVGSGERRSADRVREPARRLRRKAGQGSVARSAIGNRRDPRARRRRPQANRRGAAQERTEVSRALRRDARRRDPVVGRRAHSRRQSGGAGDVRLSTEGRALRAAHAPASLRRRGRRPSANRTPVASRRPLATGPRGRVPPQGREQARRDGELEPDPRRGRKARRLPHDPARRDRAKDPRSPPASNAEARGGRDSRRRRRSRDQQPDHLRAQSPRGVVARHRARRIDRAASVPSRVDASTRPRSGGRSRSSARHRPRSQDVRAARGGRARRGRPHRRARNGDQAGRSRTQKPRQRAPGSAAGTAGGGRRGAALDKSS